MAVPTFGQMAGYLRSRFSRGVSDKKADPTVKDVRLLSCFGDGHTIPVCPALRPSKTEEGRFFCHDCGCGDKPGKWLNGKEGEYTKIDYPVLLCPRKMPGFSNYEAGNNSEPRKIQIEELLSNIQKGIAEGRLTPVKKQPPSSPPQA